MRAIVAIARVSLIRFLRERSNIFFVFVLPLLIVLMIGLQFGGGMTSRVVVVGADTPVGRVVGPALEEAGLEVVSVADHATAVRRVEDGRAEAAVIVGDGDPLTVASGDAVTVTIAARSGSVDARTVVQAAIDEASIDWVGARVLADRLGGSPTDHAGQTAAADEAMAPLTVRTEAVGEAMLEGATQYNVGATTQLVLFTFITAMTASVYLILTRKLGVAHRMMAAPVPTWTIIAGETVGKFVVTAFQAVYILVATALLFGVDWGDPLATGAVIVALSLVGTALGVLLGSVIDNEGSASGLGVMLGISLGALGGAMVPSEFFPESVRRVSQFTPQYWAIEGLKDSVMRGGGLGDVGNELAVLALFAVVLLSLAAVAYHRSLLAE